MMSLTVTTISPVEKVPVYFLLSLFILTSLKGYGQLHVGIKGGVELATMRRDNNLNVNGGSVGFAAGVFMKKHLGDLGWFVQPEILYVGEGDNADKLNYLKIPLILGFDVSDGINVHVGYNLGILTGGDELATDGYKSLNHSLTLGMEFRALPRGSFGVRLNYGFYNIVEDPALVKNFTVRTLTSTMYLAIDLIGANR